MERIVAQHLVHGRKFAAGMLASLLAGRKLLLFFGSKFGVPFHGYSSGGFFKQNGEGFPGAMKFSPDRVRRLFGKRADLFVA